jgi:hypothetical protein
LKEDIMRQQSYCSLALPLLLFGQLTLLQSILSIGVVTAFWSSPQLSHIHHAPAFTRPSSSFVLASSARNSSEIAHENVDEYRSQLPSRVTKSDRTPKQEVRDILSSIHDVVKDHDGLGRAILDNEWSLERFSS